MTHDEHPAQPYDPRLMCLDCATCNTHLEGAYHQETVEIWRTKHAGHQTTEEGVE